MESDQETENEVNRALKVSDQHLSEAEDAMWTASDHADSELVAAELEEITAEIWAVQHLVDDLKEKLE